MSLFLFVVAIECIEIGDDSGDFNLCVFETAATKFNEVGGAANLFGQAINIDVVGLEFAENSLELGDRICVSERIRSALFGCHWVSQSISGAVLVMVPSATVVTSVSPRETSAVRRTTVPLLVRVIDQPRAKVRTGSTALSRAAKRSRRRRGARQPRAR